MPHTTIRNFLFCFGLALAGCAALGGGKVIYEKPGMFGPLFVTDDANGLRSMRFSRHGVTQTSIRVGDPDHLQYDYLKLALTGLALAESPKRVLIVGLGGGALPMFLRRNHPELAIDAVEIDPEVVTAAKLHFGFREDERLKVHVGDGRTFIEDSAPGRYDLIFLDAFGSEEVPAHLTTREFLTAVRRATTPTGAVVSNVWSGLYNRKFNGMLRTSQEVFAAVDLIETARDINCIVLALPQARMPAHGELVTRVRRLGQGRYRFDLGDLVERGHVPAPARRDDVQVLSDTGR